MDDSEFAPLLMGKLLNIGGMLEKRANQILQPYDLNQQQFSVLFEIGKAGRVRQKEMVNRLVLEKAHVSKVVKKLQQAGLIEISRSAEDRRSYWLSITDAGRARVRDCSASIQEWNREWLDGIEKEKRREIIDNLAQLQSLFRENLSRH